MDSDLEEKKKFICNNIDQLNINSEIIFDFMSTYNILYSTNNNGIFINISLLSEENIVNFYRLLKDNINNTMNEIEYEEKYDLFMDDIANHKMNHKMNHKNNSPIKKNKYKSLKLSKLQVELLKST